MWRFGNYGGKSPIFNHINFRIFGLSKSRIQNSIISEIKTVEGINISKLSPDCTFKEIGLDSLSKMEIYANLEKKFNITLSDYDTFDAQGVQDLVDIIESKIY